MDLHLPRGGRLWFLTTPHGTARSLIADIWKRIGKLQREYGLPQYSIAVFEGGTGRLHAHITFIGNRDIVRRLDSSTAFIGIEVQRVTDARGLARKYLAKFRTPQAGYRRGHQLGGRIPGSHLLDGAGDRVRLSRALQLDAIEAKYVEQWRHTNARRSASRKPYRPRALIHRALLLSGQMPLLPELERPISRLHAFGGGIVPPAVAVEIEFRRRQLGLSQRDFAARIGISQGQYANAMRGHDPISAFAINRARELGL
jgi:hypothetical protein